MKAAKIKLVKFLRDPMQMMVSGSGGYTWNTRQCQKLLDDILRAGEDQSASGHYIGTVIYVEHGILSRTPIPRYLLIDGQQRLTTLSLIALALGGMNSWREDPACKEIGETVLFNPLGRGGFRNKLVLLAGEQDVFLSIIRGEPQPGGGSLLDNYLFIKGLLEKSGLDPRVVCRGIAKLTIMPVSTDRYYENARTAYKNIEKTGLDEEQKNLITNWLGLLSSS